MQLSILVAMTANGLIGRQGELPWKLPADLQRFKRLTMGHPIIMGRKTFESIGRALPGRISIVISRQPEYRAAGAIIASSLTEAVRIAGNVNGNVDEVFVIGGGEVYSQALPLADRIYLTAVDATEADGDTFFPQIDDRQWRVVEESKHPVDASNRFPMRFLVLDRVQTSSQTERTSG